MINKLVDARLAGDQEAPAPLGSYLLSCDQIFMEAERDEYFARIPIGMVFPPIDVIPSATFVLRWKVPKPNVSLLTNEVLPFFMAAETQNGIRKEALANLIWDGEEWKVHFPNQKATPSRVETKDSLPEGAVIQIHSHGRLSPFWSLNIDDKDEKGFLIYGVVGDLGTEMVNMLLRVGINGHYHELRLGNVFTR